MSILGGCIVHRPRRGGQSMGCSHRSGDPSLGHNRSGHARQVQPLPHGRARRSRACPRDARPPCLSTALCEDRRRSTRRTLRAMSGTAASVDFRKASVGAGAVRILQDVSLVVHPGEAVGIFGSNGAGKTTLLRLVATLQPAAAGECFVLGEDLASPAKYDVRHRIGYIGHSPSLYPELSLRENLAFVADARGLDRTEALRVLDMVGLGGAADRRADHCSHGMQRRTEFARVLMTAPDLLLLDEPHSALDEDAAALVDEIVHRTIERGGSALLVSHDKERVKRLVARAHEVKEGTLV